MCNCPYKSMQGFEDVACSNAGSYGLGALIGFLAGASIGYGAMPDTGKTKGMAAGGIVGAIAGLGLGYLVKRGCPAPTSPATLGEHIEAQQAPTASPPPAPAVSSDLLQMAKAKTIKPISRPAATTTTTTSGPPYPPTPIR